MWHISGRVSTSSAYNRDVGKTASVAIARWLSKEQYPGKREDSGRIERNQAGFK